MFSVIHNTFQHHPSIIVLRLVYDVYLNLDFDFFSIYTHALLSTLLSLGVLFGSSINMKGDSFTLSFNLIFAEESKAINIELQKKPIFIMSMNIPVTAIM